MSTKVMSAPARASLPPMIPPMGPVPMTIMRLLLGDSFDLRSTYYEAANCVNAPWWHTCTLMRKEFSPRRTRRARSSEILLSETFVSFVIFVVRVIFHVECDNFG